MSYVELRAKSNFTFLTGASHPQELLETALSEGLAGMALTDVDGVYGMPRGYKVVRDQAAAARSSSNGSSAAKAFRFIVGAEFSFVDHENITVLVQTKSAYGQMCQLLTNAKPGSEKGQSHLEIKTFLETLGAKNPAEFFVLPRLNRMFSGAGTGSGDGDDKGVSNLKRLKEVFGQNLYLPLTIYLDGNDKARVARTLELSQEFSAKVVASNDVEYHIKARKKVQDVLVSIREGKSLEDVGFHLQANAERYIKSPRQMEILFKDFPKALAQTLEIAEACSFCPSELRYRYPSEWIPAGFTAQSYLEKLVWKGAQERYSAENGRPLSEATRKQLVHELQLIEELKFADYFLTIYDIVEFANRRDILCQGRGSAANSAVCYVLGITAIDPLQMNLLFERFISAERGEPPDIDIDFEHERREEVLQYIYEKYGRHRAAMVSAVVTYQPRSAFREVCKAFGVPVGTLAAKRVEREFDELAKTMPLVAEAADKPAAIQGLRDKIQEVAAEIIGFPRHLSIHSGGFTLSADPVTEIVPVEPARMEGRTIIQWDKYDLDTLGLIKVDLLSLGMLSCLQKTLKMTGKKLYELPANDPATYKMIQNRDTIGVFQIESRAQMSMLGRLQPENFYDLVVEIAIVRPGPIVGNMIHPYLKRRKGLEKVVYPSPEVEKVLGKTLGIPLFQEQIMKLAIELADFTPGEADKLRKCINAWKSSAPIGVMADRLMQGLLNNGMSQEFARQIFDQIQGFSHYGFPESHAASFALLVYASSYLKAHYPTEFACSLVNSQPMGFYRTDTILYDALRHGVTVLPVSIGRSQWDCTIEGDKILRLGFRVVKGIARKDVDALIEERKWGQFANVADFVRRSQIRKDVLHRIALAGRFEEFHTSSRDALWALLEYENLFHKKEEAQLSFFTDTNYETSAPISSMFQTLDPFEKIQSDYEAFSLSTHGHPMQELRKQIPSLPKFTSRALMKIKTGSQVSVSGLVLIRQRPPTAKGVCFATLEDEFGFMDLVLWQKVFEKYREVFLNHCFIVATGELQREGNTTNILVTHLRPIWKAESSEDTPLSIEPHQFFY